MNVLLDTHIALWAIEDNSSLSTAARKLIADASNQVFVSAVSAWEVAVKHAAHPNGILCDEPSFIEMCAQSRFRFLPMRCDHVPFVSTLNRPDSAPSHKDPFDRMLIAQAKCEGMLFLTHDHLLSHYEEPCIRMV